VVSRRISRGRTYRPAYLVLVDMYFVGLGTEDCSNRSDYIDDSLESVRGNIRLINRAMEPFFQLYKE